MLAFGPKRGADGTFSYENGSTLYYAMYSTNISRQAGAGTNSYMGSEGITVSRTSDLQRAAAGSKSAWSAPVVVNQSNEAPTTASDKEWVWVDNAASSPLFGTVYVCFTRALPPYEGALSIVCSHSTDGGASFSTPTQVAQTNAALQFRVGAQIRTDSTGVLYVVYLEVRNGQYQQLMTRSFDGGVTFGTARVVSAVGPLGTTDPLLGANAFTNRAFDGLSGARVVPLPSLDIANGAPSGVNAPDTIVVGWSDGRPGLNRGASLASFSTDGGATFAAPVVVSDRADRSMMTAVALSPDGRQFYVTYNAFTVPFQITTSAARSLLGIVRHARMTGRVPGPLRTLSRGTTGDARASARDNSTVSEFLGDYVGIAATNTGATAVYEDARRAVVCPAMNTYRQKRINGQNATAPSPNSACSAGFGNTDIFASTVLAPLLSG